MGFLRSKWFIGGIIAVVVIAIVIVSNTWFLKWRNEGQEVYAETEEVSGESHGSVEGTQNSQDTSPSSESSNDPNAPKLTYLRTGEAKKDTHGFTHTKFLVSITYPISAQLTGSIKLNTGIMCKNESSEIEVIGAMNVKKVTLDCVTLGDVIDDGNLFEYTEQKSS